MDQASIEFLRYLLPVDDKEVRNHIARCDHTR